MLWMFFMEAACDTVGGIVWDLLSAAVTPQGVYGKIASFFAKLGDLTSVAGRLGIKNDVAKTFFDNIAGVAGGIQGMVETGPQDSDIQACVRLKTPR
jgi:hypothetical protein